MEALRSGIRTAVERMPDHRSLLDAESGSAGRAAA
jgi:hypothetical protein